MPEQALTRDSVGGRAVIDRELIHIEDLMAIAATKFPEASGVERMGGRTVLVAPLLREGVAIGVIFIRRIEVRLSPKTDCPSQNLRGSSRDRDRERPPVQ